MNLSLTIVRMVLVLVCVPSPSIRSRRRESPRKSRNSGRRAGRSADRRGRPRPHPPRLPALLAPPHRRLGKRPRRPGKRPRRPGTLPRRSHPEKQSVRRRRGATQSPTRRAICSRRRLSDRRAVLLLRPIRVLPRSSNPPRRNIEGGTSIGPSRCWQDRTNSMSIFVGGCPFADENVGGTGRGSVWFGWRLAFLDKTSFGMHGMLHPTVPGVYYKTCQESCTLHYCPVPGEQGTSTVLNRRLGF